MSLTRAVTLLTLGLASLAGGQVPSGGESSSPDCEFLSAYRQQLVSGEARAASLDEIFRQLRVNPPLAILDGYWVSPIDLSLLPEAAGRQGPPTAGRRPVALAFTAGSLRDRIPLPYRGEIERAIDTRVDSPEIVIVPEPDSADAINEYLPPGSTRPEADEAECYFFCGDPSEWDFDGDGEPNATDSDDDGDGTPDDRDAYPFWPGANSCDGCGALAFVGFTEKFSADVTAAVLSAYAQLHETPESARAIDLGVRTENATSVRFLFRDEVCASDLARCPDENAPNVRYVSRDPNACATLRFRCEEGQVGFSDTCGCGCRPPTR